MPARLLHVRRLTAAEWGLFRDLRLEALADAPFAFGSALAQERQRTEADWRRRLELRAQFVVRARDAAVGTAGCVEDEGPGAELVSMWVRPDWRGQGVGDLLVRAVLDWACARGHDQVRLWVSEGNHAAERLYARHGFARTGESQPMTPDDPTRREFAMRCDLRGPGTGRTAARPGQT
jgi:GNAT superfamily N-acetyltransferase